jgi:hypothetical protein
MKRHPSQTTITTNTKRAARTADCLYIEIFIGGFQMHIWHKWQVIQAAST